MPDSLQSFQMEFTKFFKVTDIFKISIKVNYCFCKLFNKFSNLLKFKIKSSSISWYNFCTGESGSSKVEYQDIAGTIISSFFFIPNDFKLKYKALFQDDTATQYLVPIYLLTFDSSFLYIFTHH